VNERGNQAGRSDAWRPSGRQVVGGIGTLIVLVFAIANLEDANVDFVFANVTLPLFFVVVGSALIGAIAGALFSRHRHHDE
jgi:uncharacterized integral membrane protein